MIYVHVYYYSKVAEDAFKEFVAKCNPTRALQRGRCLSVAFVDGDEHWFMGQETFSRWAMGRTYIDTVDGKLYRSGKLIQMGGTDDE